MLELILKYLNIDEVYGRDIHINHSYKLSSIQNDKRYVQRNKYRDK